MAEVYILYSKKLDKYYTGSCIDLSERIADHQPKKYSDSYTAKTDDWLLYYSINNLEYQQARLIENHIKKMKSNVYIQNLKKYPEISKKLREMYK